MDDELGSQCLRRLLCAVLRRTGFDASSPDALVELEEKVLMLMGGLVHLSQRYADLARRTKPSPGDVMGACQESGISLRGLVDLLRSNAEARSQGIDDLVLLPAHSSRTTTVVLDSTKAFLTDSQSDPARMASYALSFLPYLPPSHSYKQTPVYPSIATSSQAQAAGIPMNDQDLTLTANVTSEHGVMQLERTTADKRMSQLDARIRTTRLVEASLQNLIRATSKANQQTDVAAGENAMLLDEIKQPKDDMGTLLKRYERDAAVCNFEVEWYGVGGNVAIANPAGVNALLATGAALENGQTDNAQTVSGGQGQRKRGRWKA